MRGGPTSFSQAVDLASGSALGSLEVPGGGRVYVADADLKDAFYHMGLPDALRPYFCLQGLSAALLEVHDSATGVKVLVVELAPVAIAFRTP